MQDFIPRSKDINGNIEAVAVKQFDNNSRYLHVTLSDSDLTDGDSSFNLQGCSTALYIQPEGNTDPAAVSFVAGDVADEEGGIVTFLLPGGVTQTAGNYECEIWIYEGDEQTRPVISTKKFALKVVESIKNDSAIEATQDMSAVNAALVTVQALRNQMAELAASPAGSGGDTGTEVRDARVGWDGTEYNSLGEAVRTQAENLYNTSLSFVGKFLNYDEWNTYFGASFDALPTNTFASCNVRLTDGTIEHSPPVPAGAEYLRGTVITLGREAKSRRANYDTQIFLPQDCGEIWVRKYFNNAWSGWIAVGGTFFQDEIDALPQYRAGINDAYATYENLIANVTDDGTFFVSQTATANGATVQRWNDLPTANQNFIVTNTGYSANWIIQTAIPTNSLSTVYRRLIPRPGISESPGDWIKSGELDARMKVLALGDSICAGWRNGGKGFVGDLGLPYKNAGVSGATLSTKNANVTNIPERLIEFFNYHSKIVNAQNDGWEPDIIIANGGHNDYSLGAPLGSIPTQLASDINSLDGSKVLDSLQKLFLLMILYYPNAQRFFVINHKIFRNVSGNNADDKNGYLPEKYNNRAYNEDSGQMEPTGQSYTMQQLHDAIVACCKVYNVKVIDVFNESLINSFYTPYRGTTYYANNDAGASADTINYFDKDGVHPLSRGYLEGYVPLIREAIRVGTVKN